VISHRICIPDQLQACGRTGLDHTLERDGMPSNVHQPVSEEDTRVVKCESENHNSPDEVFMVLCLKLLTDWRQDIEHGKCAGNVKE